MKTFKDRSMWMLEQQEREEDCNVWQSWMVCHTKTGGYSENEISIRVYDDGNISLWDEDEAVYLTKEQVEHLIEILRLSGKIK